MSTATVRSIASPAIRSLRERMSKGVVQWSPDAARIFALPRRERPDLLALAEDLTAQLKTPEGKQTLRPIQAWLLAEGVNVEGIMGPVGVGEGKTLPGLLLPMVIPDCKRAVLLLPASLKAQLLERDWDFYGPHWKMPNLADGHSFTYGRPVLHVVSYSELSHARAAALLKSLNPDTIIADEVHNLRHKTATRTKRFLRYFAERPNTRFAGWSGTFTSGSIEDYAHLMAIALRGGSPLPIEPSTVADWARALDPSEGFFDPGILRNLCQPGEDTREGFRRRLISTPGVVATEENQLGVSLTIHERQAPAIPEDLRQNLAQLRASPQLGGWVRPDGEELVDALRVAACARELACGFYYRWRFPNGESEELINEWFNVRQDWNRELRNRLLSAREYLDSPLLCTKAAIRFYEGGCSECERGEKEAHKAGCSVADTHPIWASFMWPQWKDLRKSVEYESEAVWMSDYLLQDALKWAKESPGIIWVEHAAVGHKLAKLSEKKFRYYGGGKVASSEILQEDGRRSIIASVDAHRDGKNLQMFNRNLIMSMPTSGAHVEQLIGRTHRPGQKADEVEVHLYRHTPELRNAEQKARSKARYIQDTLGTKQKLCYGTFTY